MFQRTERLSPSPPIDFTHPNYSFKKNIHIYVHYFQEKKILSLLLQENISERDYQRLIVLIQLPIPEELCIAQKEWLPLLALENYPAFKRKERAIKAQLQSRLDFIKHNPPCFFRTDVGNLI